jgi:hypothetical protein
MGASVPAFVITRDQRDEIDVYEDEAKLIEAIIAHLDELIAIGHKRIDAAADGLAG